MEYEERTYFAENEFDDVKGFTVLKAKDGKYHIAEKWLATDDNRATEDSWIDYWIPEDQLIERHNSETDEGEPLCEPKGKLTDEQFEAVCEMVGWYTDDEAEKAVA